MRNLFRFSIRILGVGLLLAALAGCSADLEQNSGASGFFTNLEAENSVLNLDEAAQVISQYRKTNGLGPVRIDPELVAVAQDHANKQARADKLSHSVGGSLRSRLKVLKERRKAAAENIGAGYRTFAQAFSGWRNSKGHNANLLNEDMTRIGIAKAVNPNSKFKVYWTLILSSEPL